MFPNFDVSHNTCRVCDPSVQPRRVPSFFYFILFTFYFIATIPTILDLPVVVFTFINFSLLTMGVTMCQQNRMITYQYNVIFSSDDNMIGSISRY